MPLLFLQNLKQRKGRDTNALTVTAARAECYPHPNKKGGGTYMKNTADHKEIEQFIKLMQSLNHDKQVGLLLMTQGARLLADSDKQKKQRT